MGVSRRAIEEKPGRQSGREEEGIGVHRRVEQQGKETGERSRPIDSTEAVMMPSSSWTRGQLVVGKCRQNGRRVQGTCGSRFSFFLLFFLFLFQFFFFFLDFSRGRQGWRIIIGHSAQSGPLTAFGFCHVRIYPHSRSRLCTGVQPLYIRPPESESGWSSLVTLHTSIRSSPGQTCPGVAVRCHGNRLFPTMLGASEADTSRTPSRSISASSAKEYVQIPLIQPRDI
jgi:hypothetical protein